MLLENKESSILLIKPDALELGIEQEVYDAMTTLLKLNIRSKIDVLFDQETILNFWPGLYGQEFIARVFSHLVNRRVIWSIVDGGSAVSKILEYKRHIRRKYPGDKILSRIHCSDSPSEYVREKEIMLRLCHRMNISATSLLCCE